MGECRSPLGPRVTPTASATLLMPSCSFFRDALSNQISFASARVTCAHARGQAMHNQPPGVQGRSQALIVPLITLTTP